MRIIDVDYLKQSMRDENAFVLKCEELFHDKISSASAKIINARDKGNNIVCISGPSGSGKTTTALRLKDYLENICVPVKMLSMDNFFLSKDKRPKEIGDDWESPLCVDSELLIKTINDLHKGKTVELPQFDFMTGYRKEETIKMEGDSSAIIIAEGIHMLNPIIFDKIKDITTGIYAAPRTRVLTESEKLVKAKVLRLARRMLRDLGGRGHSLAKTVLKAASVNRGEDIYINPYNKNAQIQLDTFHDYEPCILANYLLGLEEFEDIMNLECSKDAGMVELHELIKSVPPLKTKYVPKDSLIREFVGGSLYSY